MYIFHRIPPQKKHLKITGIFGGINDLGEGERKKGQREKD